MCIRRPNHRSRQSHPSSGLSKMISSQNACGCPLQKTVELKRVAVRRPRVPCCQRCTCRTWFPYTVSAGALEVTLVGYSRRFRNVYLAFLTFKRANSTSCTYSKVIMPLRRAIQNKCRCANSTELHGQHLLYIETVNVRIVRTANDV